MDDHRGLYKGDDRALRFGPRADLALTCHDLGVEVPGVTRRKYRNPPIEEALCEFQFADGKDWDLATPARLQDAFRKRYPAKPRFQQSFAANLAAGPQSSPSIALMQGTVKTQFTDDAGTNLVSVAPGLLSIHVLRPYCGWEVFRPQIEEAVSTFATLTGATTVTRIGVRYINKITLPNADDIDLHLLFRCIPPDVPELPTRLVSFMHRTEHAHEEDTSLIMTLASLAEPRNEVLLDLDVIRHREYDPSAAMHAVEELRTHQRNAFEAVITDELRSQFDAA